MTLEIPASARETRPISYDRSAPGDYELSEVFEFDETDWGGVSEDDHGTTVSCHANRLESGSDRVEVWRIDSEDPAPMPSLLDRLA